MSRHDWCSDVRPFRRLRRRLRAWRTDRRLLREYGTTDRHEIAAINALRWLGRVDDAAQRWVEAAAKVTDDDWRAAGVNVPTKESK